MSNPIRVLQVFAQMNRGGAETMIMNIYRNIDRSKVQFDFLVHTYERCAYDKEIESLGGKIYRLPRYRGYNHIKYKREWGKFLQEHREYKLIHGHVRSTASIYSKVAKKYGLITIIHSHSTNSRGNLLERIIKGILQYRIRHIADYFFACSEEAGCWLFGKNTIKSNRFNIVKNSIDVNDFKFKNEKRKHMKEMLNISNKFVVGHIGSFTYAKNHEYLIEIFKEVIGLKIDAVLLLIGDGELKSKIVDKIRKMGLEQRVIITGTVSNVHDYLQAMDVFVFPSHYEGMGMAVLESQAAGLPSFVSDSIPDEVLVTDLVKRISTKKSPKHWANIIANQQNNNARQLHNRVNYIEEIISSGYDIKNATDWLMDYYLKAHNLKVIFWGMSDNLGGIETYLLNLSRKFSQSGITIKFLVTSKTICFEEEILNLGHEIYSIPNRRPNPISFYWALFAFFRKHKDVKVAHFFLQSSSVIEPVILAKLNNFRTIVDSRSDYKGKKKITRILDGINKKVLPIFTDEMLAISEASGKSMFKNQKFKVVKSAIDSKKYRFNPNIRRSYRTKLNVEDKIVIGHVGRFTYEKNHNFIIDIFKALHIKDPNIVLLLVGDGILKPAIQKKVEEAGLTEKVIFTGIRSDIPELMQAMDLFIFPSHFEGLGRVVIEAQAAGLRTIVSDSVPREVFITNLVKRVSLDEPIDIWIENIFELINKYERNDINEEVSRSGYDIHSSISNLKDIYLSLIGR